MKKTAPLKIYCKSRTFKISKISKNLYEIRGPPKRTSQSKRVKTLPSLIEQSTLDYVIYFWKIISLKWSSRLKKNIDMRGKTFDHFLQTLWYKINIFRYSHFRFGLPVFEALERHQQNRSQRTYVLKLIIIRTKRSVVVSFGRQMRNRSTFFCHFLPTIYVVLLNNFVAIFNRMRLHNDKWQTFNYLCAYLSSDPAYWILLLKKKRKKE